MKVIIKVTGHQHQWLAGGYDLEIGHFQRWLQDGYLVHSVFLCPVSDGRVGLHETESSS